MFATHTTQAQPQMIDLDQIRIDGKTQQRNYLRRDVVDEYAVRMAEGVEFPPILVFDDGTDKWLVDGYHRYEARKQLKRTQINAIIESGTLEDAQWASSGVNSTHGLRRTREDLQMSVTTAIKHPRSKGLSMREIGRHVGCDHKTVSAIWDKLRFAGENPHAPPPERPAWLDQIDVRKSYPYNTKTKRIFDSPEAYWGQHTPWGEHPDDVGHAYGRNLADNKEYWEYELCPAPEPGAVAWWIADVSENGVYIIHHTLLYIYAIPLVNFWSFVKPGKEIETVRGERIHRYPWLYEKHVLITAEKPFGDEYQKMLELVVAAGNKIATPPPPEEQSTGDQTSFDSTDDPSAGGDNSSASNEPDEEEDRLTETVYDDIDTALKTFGDLLAAICASHSLTVEDMTAALDTYSLEDVVFDALQRAKQVA